MNESHSHTHTHVDGIEHTHIHEHASMSRARIATTTGRCTRTCMKRRATTPTAELPRPKGSKTGPTRSTRLPIAIDSWLGDRQAAEPHRSPSEILVELIHGGLRLRHGYMAIHRRSLERLIVENDAAGYRLYVAALLDTFGNAYVEHLERWLVADGFSLDAVTAP